MRINNLNDLLVEQLKDLYSAQNQAEKAFDRWSREVATDELRDLFKSQIEQTNRHKGRIQQICNQVGVSPTGEHCEGMEGLIREGDALPGDAPKGPTRDAGMIAMAQRIQHYNMAGYGCARAYASHLELEESAGVLQTMLEEATSIDDRMTELAEAQLNEAAVEA